MSITSRLSSTGQKAPSQHAMATGSKKADVLIFKPLRSFRLEGAGVMTRVKSGILVSAALRYASNSMIDCVLERRGDADAGAIFVHIDALDGRHQLLCRVLDFDGIYKWQPITQDAWTDAETVAARLATEIKADPDIFVVAVTDSSARNPFDGL
jgi:hypothetical protein